MDKATLVGLYAYVDIPGVLWGMLNVVFIMALIKWHQDDTPFDFRHALLDPVTEKVSVLRLGQTVALVTSTGLITYEAMKGRLSEWLFVGYMTVWAGAYVASKINDAWAPPRQPPEEKK